MMVGLMSLMSVSARTMSAHKSLQTVALGWAPQIDSSFQLLLLCVVAFFLSQSFLTTIVSKTLQSSRRQADAFTEWVFRTHGDSDLVRAFVETMNTLKTSQYADGVPIGSMCSGWGVAEMILECLNDKLNELMPHLPQAILFWTMS